MTTQSEAEAVLGYIVIGINIGLFILIIRDHWFLDKWKNIFFNTLIISIISYFTNDYWRSNNSSKRH